MAQGLPVIFQAVNDQYVDGARIAHILWVGSTSIGDQAEVLDIETSQVIWPGRAADVNTYLGMNFGPKGIGAPKGFRASILDSARLYIYLLEV